MATVAGVPGRTWHRDLCPHNCFTDMTKANRPEEQGHTGLVVEEAAPETRQPPLYSVVLLNDDLMAMAQELVFADLLDRSHIGLDFFDATISRTAAWVIGVRNMQKALLRALLLPQAQLKAAEGRLDFTERLLLSEESKDLPFAAVWAEFCDRENVPTGPEMMADLKSYQSSVSDRNCPKQVNGWWQTDVICSQLLLSPATITKGPNASVEVLEHPLCLYRRQRDCLHG